MGPAKLEMNGNHHNQDAEESTILLPPYLISRNVLLQNEVTQLTDYQPNDKRFKTSIKKSCSKFDCLTFLLNLIPIFQWLPKYSIRKDFVGDLVAGITVAVMHIPQGMAYGLLAGVTPSSGLYMAFFPTLVYFVFGTSKHISVGTLSVISIMTLKVVNKYSIQLPLSPTVNDNTNNNSTIIGDLSNSLTGGIYYTPNQVVTATAFMCGIQHIVMYILRLGKLSSLLSESLVNGFTTGAAMHVLASQLKDLFGVNIPRHQGLFQIIHTIIDFFKQLPQSNLNTMIISLLIIIFMIIMNELVKPYTSKFCRFPIPAELIAVVGGTVASYAFDLGPNYNVKLVGSIPLGLPEPEMPPIKLLWLVMFDAIAISIVSYSVTISMAMILAKKQNYEVRPNQELFALGMSNIIGGLFSCIPNATSLSRSLIQELTGGKTQITSVISSLLILGILLWIGPLFEILPRCVLSGIIVVALKGMYMQATQLLRFRKEGKLELFTWIVTFIAVVLVDVDIGLVLGICVSLIGLYIKGWKTTSHLLGCVPSAGLLAATTTTTSKITPPTQLNNMSDLYVDLSTHRNAIELPNIRIFRYTGAINFAFHSSFKKSLYKTIEINYKQISVKKSNTATTVVDKDKDSSKLIDKQQLQYTATLIIDLTCVTHIDIAGLKTCYEIQNEMISLSTEMILTGPNDRVYDAICHFESLELGKFLVMPSIHDAVTYAKARDKHQIV